MLTLVGMQGVGTSSCYDRKVRSEIHSPAAYHHKSTDCLIKITVHLQLLTTPHQIRAVRSFGEYRPGENEIDVSARQRSQQLWRENPQFRAILAVNFESENDSNKLSGGERGIRTLDTVSRIHAFQACAFNHSATSPGARSPKAARTPHPFSRSATPCQAIRCGFPTNISGGSAGDHSDAGWLAIPAGKHGKCRVERALPPV